MRKFYGTVLLVVFLLNLAGCDAAPVTPNPPQKTTENEKVDDWKYNPVSQQNESSRVYSPSSGGGAPFSIINPIPPLNKQVKGDMGFSVGGAKDINNFRENLKNGFFPNPNDITYEGLFYNYFFDTGKTEECTKLFCPSYSTAVSNDPVSDKQEYYMSVGLNSGMKEADFKRKKLNLVVVLDISGSMGSSFNQYYYDRFGNKQVMGGTQSESEKELARQTKMEVATKSLTKLLDHLSDDDKFGMVLFDDISYPAKPLNNVGFTKMDALKEHVLAIGPRGGTNMDAGIQEGTRLFEGLTDANPDEYENRIVFITDAMPNTGDSSENGLFTMVKRNADKKIYTTFIGVGVDFNTTLVETMSKIKGANYYSVHSEDKFKEVLDQGFDYMVTPLVFDLNLVLESEGFAIDKVFGSPEAHQSTGEIMKINTLFPSKTEDSQTKGGVVLIKLKKTPKFSESGTIKLRVNYEDRNGKKDSDEKVVRFTNPSAEDWLTRGSGNVDGTYYDNIGIRKAILLTRYANLLKAWTVDEYKSASDGKKFLNDDQYSVTRMNGIPCIDLPVLGQWERQSVKLSVSSYYQKLFTDFGAYFASEVKGIGDDSLKKELDVIDALRVHPVILYDNF